MKKQMRNTVIASMLAIGLIAGTVIAQSETETIQSPQQMRGKMMGGGMMGMQEGQGMMGSGGMGMMGGQDDWGMGCKGMMGGAMMSQMSPGQRQEFMNQTVDLRKQMMEKRFAYMEAMRNPDTTPQDLANIEKSMLELRSQMMDKMKTMQNE